MSEAKTGVVYQIRNISSGTAYIGSSIEHIRRWSVHRRELRDGLHHCAYLQRAWLKYGEHEFEFCVIEDGILESNLIVREQFWIDDRISKLPRSSTYNTCLHADGCRGRAATDETRKRLSDSHIGIRRTIESRLKQSDSWSNRSGAKSFTLKGPNGTIHSNITNLRRFSREHGLCEETMSAIANGRVLSHRGWCLPGHSVAKYTATSPDGEIYDEVSNLKLFCVEHGLPYKQMHKTINLPDKKCRGWSVTVVGHRRRVSRQ